MIRHDPLRNHHTTHARRGFTAIELALVLSIVLILVTAGTVVTLPMMRRAAFTQAAASLDDVAAQARLLARHSTDKDNFYGVVVRNIGGIVTAAITCGPTPTWGTVVMDAGGKPMTDAQLGRLAMVYLGSSHAAATALPDGSEIGWMYRSGSGRLATSTATTLAPAFVGVTTAEATAAGVIDPAVIGAEALSLRSPDHRQMVAVAVYASGALATCRID